MSSGVSTLRYQDLSRLFGAGSVLTGDTSTPDSDGSAPPPLPPEWQALTSWIPGLEKPTKSLEMDGVELLLGQLQSLVTSAQTKVSSETNKLSHQQRKELQQKNIEKQKIATENAKKAKDAANSADIGQWFQDIATLVAALVAAAIAYTATAFSAGGAAALAVGATILVMDAVMGVINHGLQEGGVMTTNASGETVPAGCGFDKMIDAIQNDMLKSGDLVLKRADGSIFDRSTGTVITQEDADKLGKKVVTAEDLNKGASYGGMAIQIFMIAAAIVLGAGGAKLVETAVKEGVEEGAMSGVEAAEKVVSKTSKMSIQGQRAGELADLGVTAVGGAGAVVTGAYHADKAVIDQESAQLMADKRFNDRVIKLLAQQQQQLQDSIRTLIDALADFYSGATDVSDKVGKTLSQIGQNIHVKG